MPEEVKNNAAEQAAQAQKQPVPMPTTYEALRHDLIASGRAYDFDMIDRAYQLASAAHATQFRRSGEPYICHPISVAQLLVELGMDSESVAAALMHDVAEDTVYETDRAENRQDINGVYGIRKNNKKDDNDADQCDISSPVKWFFLHKFQPF